ncbi:MAG: TlpA family protein disulfide reductase [Sulfuricella sp.]|nr:TlpA family protein disulfide reductase [Sulfuricella sp.]
MPNRFKALLLFWLFLALPHAVQAAEAINFNFTDTVGKHYQLSDLKGKWVLVNFWAPWCPPCWKELPDLNDLQKARRDIVVIGIAMDYKDEDSVLYLLKKHKIDFPVVMGGKSRGDNNPIKQVGPVPFYPTSYLYAPDNQIVMVKMGMVDQDMVNHFIYDYMQDNDLKKWN